MDYEKPQNERYQISEINLSDPAILKQVEDIEDAILEKQDVAVLWVNNPLFTLGAKSENTIIGVVQVSTDGHVNYIVHPEHQGKGIATQLLQEAVSGGKIRKIPGLSTTVTPNSTSQHILEKQGFIVVTQEGEKNIKAKKLNESN